MFITESPERDVSVGWSPDGTRIVFAQGQPGMWIIWKVWDVITINIDGTNLFNLTNKEGFDAKPSWSPDGQKIAFLTGNGYHRQIALISPDGTVSKLLPFLQIDGKEIKIYDTPMWSPDGLHFIISALSPDNRSMELYMVDIDGSNPKLILTMTDIWGYEWIP